MIKKQELKKLRKKINKKCKGKKGKEKRTEQEMKKKKNAVLPAIVSYLRILLFGQE
jgi:hypothetical protein